jgi:hypothetical protein
MRAGPDFGDHLGEDVADRAARLVAQLVQSKGSDEHPFELVPSQADVVGERRQISGDQRKLQLLRDRQHQRLALLRRLGREERDVDV